MSESVEQLLAQIARRGSWIGGGSVAALSAALAAALLEKLAVHPQTIQTARGARRTCMQLVRQDATTFARAIRATRAHHRQAFARALKAATDIQAQVLTYALAIQEACRCIRRMVKPQFQSDLCCAMYLARAAGDSARTLIETNLAWLDEPSYTARMRAQMRRASSRRDT